MTKFLSRKSTTASGSLPIPDAKPVPPKPAGNVWKTVSRNDQSHKTDVTSHPTPAEVCPEQDKDKKMPAKASTKMHFPPNPIFKDV